MQPSKLRAAGSGHQTGLWNLRGRAGLALQTQTHNRVIRGRVKKAQQQRQSAGAGHHLFSLRFSENLLYEQSLS